MFLNNFLLSIFLILAVFILLYPRSTLKILWLFLAIFYLNPLLSKVNTIIFYQLDEQVFVYIIVLSLVIIISIVEGVFIGITSKEVSLIISSILVAVLFFGIGLERINVSMTTAQIILRLFILVSLLFVNLKKK